jgi:molybdopterin synthase catalytic subunit
VTVHAGVHEKGTISLMDIISGVRSKASFHETGAIAIFVGVVRGETLEGQKVQKLRLEAYEEKADEVLQEICDDLGRTPGILDVQIHHLLGEFTVGEDLVYVLVAGSHRNEVFSVLQEAVERYKEEAPIFKKEYIVSSKGERNAYWTSEKRVGLE